jgi:hypothetical protein
MTRLAGLSVLSILLAACGGDGGAKTDAASAPSEKTSTAAKSDASSAAWKPAIKTASLPEDPCAVIPVADVEAIVGPLAGPPKRADGCRYTLLVPEAVTARREKQKEQQRQLQEKLSKAFGTPPSNEPTGFEALDAKLDDPQSYAVTLAVEVDGDIVGEQAMSSVSKQFLGILGNEADDSSGKSKAPTDWDDIRNIPYGFVGRVGHVRVSAANDRPDMPIAPLRALAERARDRVPDQPFAITNPYQVIQLGTVGDPCSLLTRAEAEAVLGPLSVDPYRSSSEKPALAHGKGYACAYFTPGHHVFAIAPTWSGGEQNFKIDKGIGGLVGLVAPPEQQVIMKGPWDQAHSGMSGALLFLKGDRLLEVHYGTSRATRGDAVKLAAIAMKRLAP